MYTNRLLPLVLLACLCSAAPAQTTSADTRAPIAPDACLYLPPSFANRVVFYDGFDLPTNTPEINRIQAQLTGSSSTTPEGFAGLALRWIEPTPAKPTFEVRSAALSPARPLTVMRWWKIESKMLDTSSFQLLALLGKGHISCFVHGKGEWCALKRPTMFVQVHNFPSIANVNQAVLDNAWYQPGDWHHIAITIANASEVSFYLDGSPLITVQTKGRPFSTDDINTLQPSSGHGELPTTTDELIVVDRVVSPAEIERYVRSATRLRDMHFPPIVKTTR